MKITNFLNKINSPQDLRFIKKEDLKFVCAELRQFLIDEILLNGGHFSANLGTVELTVATHYVFNTPFDQLIWDVGHQAYGHKVLTGRRDIFNTIRKKDGISGFPKITESRYDNFGTGHSSTSISAALGMAEADLLKGINRHHIAIIGDGSLTAGMAWEALNNAAVSQGNLLIIINDNHMSIDPNTGALNHYLEGLKKGKPNFFTDLGFQYFGANDGHDIDLLVKQAEIIKKQSGPKIWHIKTIKGKGFAEAEAEQTKWHAVKYVKIHEPIVEAEGEKFQQVFGLTLLDLAKQNENVVGITPAMPSGSSMNILMREMPERTFDVGIAEQHAVTFAAGMAVNGMIVFCNVYSTFLQRAYDQVIHDVCLQNIPVIFCLDRAGVAGEDGATHHGLYDIAFLRCLPNITIAVPSNELELRQMMYTASENNSGPIAIRYPKGNGINLNWRKDFIKLAIGKGLTIQIGKKVAFLCLGVLLNDVLKAAENHQEGLIGIYDMRFAKPLDEELLLKIFDHYETIFTIEDGCISGGFGSAVLEFANKNNYVGQIQILGFPDELIPHATREELFQMYELDVNSLKGYLEKALNV